MKTLIARTRTRIGAVLVGLAAAGCGADNAPAAVDGLPPLTAEESALVANMEKNTLAEIALPEGKMRFVEIEPGQILVQRQIRIGAAITRIPGEGGMTLDQIFRAYAPHREVPPALFDAMARMPAPDLSTQAATLQVPPPATFVGTQKSTGTAESPGAIERAQSALASSVDQTWFVQNFCKFSGVDYSWCFTTAWQGAWAAKHSHRTNSITCGDTGAARTVFSVNGSAKAIVDVPYGQCWYTGSYHGPHGLFGVNLERDLKQNVTFAQSTVRFSGWFADEDQFVVAF